MASKQLATVEIEVREGRTTAILDGAFTIRSVGAVEGALKDIRSDTDLLVDIERLEHLDTAGAWSLTRLEQRLQVGGGSFRLRGATSRAEALLDTVAAALDSQKRAEGSDRPEQDQGFVEQLGRRVAEGVSTLLGMTGYLGIFLSRLARLALRPRQFRVTALVHHCEDVGVRAVPIVALMGFLIGVVLAFQGAVQLRQFGAEVFVVDLISVSILRELGILLTAIIVAGRTASAFTAAIGSMKMREEIDAMRTLGLDTASVLFVPRILALLLMLPILGLIANVSGLVGGALMSWIELGISPEMFRVRLLEGENVNHLGVGLVKAPVFAIIIGVVGCYCGMQVKGNADSLGQQTSRSVVAAIFLVIVADALFSIFFSELGV
ncbi:MAG: putative ABC transport system permease protein [Rhodobacteraceae bacterium HLUCCO18]|nr:MAG: putative ABC transport system permease protein [Rhodobacteraceae bacterium HLUCCO18]